MRKSRCVHLGLAVAVGFEGSKTADAQIAALRGAAPQSQDSAFAIATTYYHIT